MKTLLQKLIVNYPYVISVILFIIGALTVLTRSNLFKKLLGINVMETAIFLMFIASGNIRGGAVPILSETEAPYINPPALRANAHRHCGQHQRDRFCLGADPAPV